MTVAWAFGDGFDAYREIGDAILGYWDSGTTANSALGQLNSGRFIGSRSLFMGTGGSATVATLVKSSGSNDTTHHISVAHIARVGALSGTATGWWFTFSDGTTAQCSIFFKNNGDIILAAGTSTGSVLATYSSAFTANVWNYFEFEVVINNSTGSFKVRKNGNVSDDFSATGLNTRASANNYANKLSVGALNTSSGGTIDDLLWRSDSTVAWVGDIRCFTRMPTADSSVQFTPSSASLAITPFVQGTTQTITTGRGYYAPFVATASGTLASVVLSLAAGFTGNIKLTLFNDSGLAASVPTTIVGSATTVTNPTSGNNTFTFGSPPAVVQGTLYWVGIDSDTTTSSALNTTTSITSGLPPTGAYANSGLTSTTAYASFPAANPSISGVNAFIFTANITPTTANNAMLVGEVIEDQAGTYVSDSTVNHADFYTPSSIGATPSSVVCVTTRALCQKSDAGTRNIAVQIKSGSNTSTGSSTALNTTWGWIFKTDQTDPDTGVAWTATGVNNATFGPKLTA